MKADFLQHIQALPQPPGGNYPHGTPFVEALSQAGFEMKDVVRVNYYISDPAFSDAIIPVLGRWFSEVRPAATLLVVQLMKPEMKIEIDVTAMKA